MATGVLVVAVGPATRFLQYLPLEPKVYRGVIRFGVVTDSMDREGKVVQTLPTPNDLMDRIQDSLPAFRGSIEQIPPMHSAIKRDGKPLYEYARKGQEVERHPRKVHIDSYDVLSVSNDDVEVRVVCSGGTYVRSLAHDLGQAVGCGAHLIELRREAVGRFKIESAIELANIEESHLIPLKDALSPMPQVCLSAEAVSDIRMGRQIPDPSDFDTELVTLVDESGAAFGIARRNNQKLQPECVIPIGANL
jgi:tRNA pseudouridine55 synthase